MLIQNQKIEMKWNNSNKEWYENKGYNFTKNRDVFYINAEDLPPRSHKKIECECDLCHEKYVTEYTSYHQNIERNGEFHCFKCAGNADLRFVDRRTTKNRKSVEEVIEIVEGKNNNKLLNPNDYINVFTKNLKVLCGSCGEEFTTSLSSIMNSEGACPKCGVSKCTGANRLTGQEVEKRINMINNNKLLNPEEYVSYGTINLRIKCGECGEIFTTSLANYEGNDKIRCGNCSTRISKLERRVMDFLNYYGIQYEYEKKFEDCCDKKCLPFDFYLPDYNLIIETDGQGHYEPIFGEESFLRTLLHDGMKNNYCRWNNFKLLRIPYFKGGQIEKILSEELGVGDPFKKIPYTTHNSQYFRDHFKEKKTA